MKLSEFNALAPEQRRAIRRMAQRSQESILDVIDRAYVTGTRGDQYVGVPDWCGMFIGVERDGYTHS